MKTLLAIENGGHPFWNRYSYSFHLLNHDNDTDTPLSFRKEFEAQRSDWTNFSIEYYIKGTGVYARLFACGSGYGKAPMGEEFLVYPRSNYDNVIIIPNEEKREAERNYQGNWQDNSDFQS